LSVFHDAQQVNRYLSRGLVSNIGAMLCHQITFIYAGMRW